MIVTCQDVSFTLTRMPHHCLCGRIVFVLAVHSCTADGSLSCSDDADGVSTCFDGGTTISSNRTVLGFLISFGVDQQPLYLMVYCDFHSKRLSLPTRDDFRFWPCFIAQCNIFMSATGRMDHNIAHLCINIHINKWWWVLFCLAIHAWQSYWPVDSADRQKCTLDQFHREMTLT